MNVSRRAANGEIDKEEVLNKSQIFVTTAGWKSSFSYQKLIQILLWQIMKPGKAIAMGGTYRVPVYFGLLDRNFVNDVKEDETYEESSFAREYESIWSGSSDGAFFNVDSIDQNRTLSEAEDSYNVARNKEHYYIISVDVARTHSCQTVATVFKVEPQMYGGSTKKLVNIFVYEAAHFGDQALYLKRLFFRYQPKQIVIDGNGLGIGLIDFMVQPSVDPESGETYPGFLPSNDENDLYKRFKVEGAIQNIVYILKANASLNTAIHSNAAIQLKAGRVKFLMDERQKKGELLASKEGSAMTQKERAEYLRPFVLTGILKEEMLNLREETEGVNIILKKASNRILKDKFSAFEYGLYYIKFMEDTGQKRKRLSAAALTFIN